MSAWCASIACESCCPIHVLVRAYSKRRACDIRAAAEEVPSFGQPRVILSSFSHWKRKMSHVQKAHIVCCEIFCRRTTYNTSRVFCSLTLPFFLFVSSCSVLLHLYSCVFLFFRFSFLSFPRVAPCDEEQHPVYIHHAVDAFFSGGTYERSKWGT